MSKTRKKVNKAAGKSANQPKPRSGKRKFVTRAEARQRAERHVLNRMFKGARVRNGATACLHIYVPEGQWTNEDVWVVYKNLDEIAFKSSSVVLVCKRTGRVLYEGPAGDEG